MEVVVIIILFVLVFGASQITSLIARKRNGDNALIREPWVEIHEIPKYNDARKIAAFYPLKGEPNILPILEELAMEGRLLLPRCTGEGTMEFFPVNHLKKDLEKGKFGIMEPKQGLEPWTDRIPVFLVPGVKFNLDGRRVGHGKGYYDRYLAKHPESFKAGIATPKQIDREPLIQKPTDIPMNTVIVCKPLY
ncbi:MAG: 5-formyltetrahydrofolate cyclo-ligase [Fibrobacteraceae bacterium]|nr:5-formyltetrahydrofolate cyclo-ligase [Fibrobacteraceae bacterium]